MKGLKIILTIITIVTVVHTKAQIWSSVNGGVTYGSSSTVSALKVFDGKLYVTGNFNTAGNVTCNNIAIWNGSNWDTIPGGGIEDGANDMCVYNGNLFIGGGFQYAGMVANTRQVAGHNGNNWFALGLGGTEIAARVYTIASYNGTLVLGGNFTQFGGLPFNGIGRIVRWMGSYWDKMSGGVTGGMMTSIYCMAEYNDKLYVGGDFTKAGNVPANYIATWDGVKWDSIGSGADGVIVQMFVDTTNNELYIHGGISIINGISTIGIAKYDGTQWTNIPTPPTSNGFGRIGFYHGYLFTVNSKNTNLDTTFAYYDGINWHSLLNGPNGFLSSWAEYKDTLYIGGYFDSVGTQKVNSIAKFFIPQNPNSVKPLLERKNSSELLANIPNPFEEETTITFALPKREKGIIKVFNSSGVCVRELNLKPESNKIDFKSNDLENGIYYYTLVVNETQVKTKKMIICK